MDLPDPLITISPEYLGGAPIFTGTRVPVRRYSTISKAETPWMSS